MNLKFLENMKSAANSV